MDFRLLGPLEVVVGDDPLPLGQPKQRTLLALLLLRANEVVSRETAIDALWAESPPERAANALQVYVHGLRKAVGAERISLRGAGYSIAVDGDELDLHRFERLVAQGQGALARGDTSGAVERLAAALACWRGEPLADLPGDALTDERARLAELRVAAVELHTDARLAAGRDEDLVPELEALVAVHPYRERLRGQLMLALYRADRQAEALDAFQSARRVLREELGLEPGPALREVERAILRQDPSLRPTGRRPELRLPEQRTALVGRALDVAAVCARLREAPGRLLTLAGPGGVGKTRLAIEAAAELGSELANGAFFVDLAPVADAAQVAATVAAAVGVDEADRRTPLDAVVARLRGIEAVLVLDNFERLTAAAGVATELLDGAPAVRILVTSRTPLRLAGEEVYDVAPLPVPAEAEPFESLSRNASVAVFVARARATDRHFELSDGNAPAVGAVCRALEGLPLALELAAARVKVLAPAQILDRLEQPLALLTGGGRDLPERQQTLRATIDWSYELLGVQERRLFAELAVFAGGCTFEAAEDVCAAELEPLAALLDSGLLQRQQARGGEPRFRMLDAVRRYASELLEAGDAGAVRDRHARWFATLAEAVGPELIGPRMPAALGRLAREQDNLRAALTHALGADTEIGFRIVAPLGWFWATGARGPETRVWLESAFGDSRAASSPAQVGALVVLGRLLMITGEYEAARDTLDQASADATRLECWGSAAVAATYLAWLAAAAGDYDANLRFAEEGIELGRRSGNRWAERQGLAMVAGALINRGEHEAARPYLDRSLQLARLIDDPATSILATANSGYGALCAGDLGRARELLEEGLRLSAELDDPVSTVRVLHLLAWEAGLAGEGPRARDHLREALVLLHEGGHHTHRVDVLGEVAVALGESSPETAARLLGADDAGFAAAGMRRSVPAHDRIERLRAGLSARLGEDGLRRRVAEGAGLSLDEAIDEALASVSLPA